MGKQEMVPFLPQEDLRMAELYRQYGPHWKTITEHFPGRTVASVRNRFLRMQGAQKVRAEGGITRNRCQLCGQPKRGHICTKKLDLVIAPASRPAQVAVGGGVMVVEDKLGMRAPGTPDFYNGIVSSPVIKSDDTTWCVKATGVEMTTASLAPHTLPADSVMTCQPLLLSGPSQQEDEPTSRQGELLLERGASSISDPPLRAPESMQLSVPDDNDEEIPLDTASTWSAGSWIRRVEAVASTQEGSPSQAAFSKCIASTQTAPAGAGFGKSFKQNEAAFVLAGLPNSPLSLRASGSPLVRGPVATGSPLVPRAAGRACGGLGQ